MKFFKFKSSTFQWSINIYQEDYEDIIAPMNDNIWIKDEVLPLKMRLIDSFENFDAWQGETPFVDVLTWYTNLMTADVEPTEGTNLLMSRKVKEVIEKYNLPEHRFYPVILHCKELQQTNEEYFLFHAVVENAIVGDDIIDYPKCTFVEITQDSEGNNVPVKIYPEGFIKSSNEKIDIQVGDIELLGTYEVTYGSQTFTELNELKFKNKVYKYDYDVLWGLSGLLYISEEIKNELEAVGITNGSFFELKENMIRPFEYEQMKNS
ncbi:hypothetical protein KUL118_40080 [Tenacibaculum sp. KUL118]|nr:hypothetical protein KUL118_40080 [Tenacibaculum sp. KUL118]